MERRFAFITNGAYLNCTLISIYSLLSTAGEPVVIDLTLDAPDAQALKLARRIETLSHITRLELSVLDGASLPDNDGSRFPRTIWARLNLPFTRTGRVVYADGDTIFRKDATRLLRMDMHGLPIWAAPCADHVRLHEANQNPLRRLISPADRRAAASRMHDLDRDDLAGCVNAGLIVFDCDRCAEMPDMRRRLDPAIAAGLPNFDNDVLNKGCGDVTGLLDPEWNSLWGNAKMRSWYVSRAVQGQFRRSIEDPAMVHFAGGRKPWREPAGSGRGGLRRRQRARFTAEFRQVWADAERALGVSLPL